jgi:mono/diheme cytochrome c family protein
MHGSTDETEAPTRAKLAIVSVLSAALALSIGCRSGESTLRAYFTLNPSRPSKTVKARPLNDRKFQRTPERLARGKYIVNGMGECFACHGPSDPSRPGWPPVRGKEGSGYADYTRSGELLYVAANLTPDRETGVGNWTDDMLARAIREGVGRDGRLLDPTHMPYEFYRAMSDEDLASIIVYLRSIPAIRNPLPAPKRSDDIAAPFAIPINAPVPVPDSSTPVKRGAYLVQIGACQWCHTLRDQQTRQPLSGLEFAGGDLINPNPFGQATSANITPDSSGISYYDEAFFLRVIHTGKVGARKLNPVMPWWFFGHMSDNDLKAIFAYLRTLPPVHHRVDNTEPIAYCRVCKRKHHGGALN